RPSERDHDLPTLLPVPESPSYPSEHAAAAQAAATVLVYLLPAEAQSFQTLAQQAGWSRVQAGLQYPSDYYAGLERPSRAASRQHEALRVRLGRVVTLAATSSIADPTDRTDRETADSEEVFGRNNGLPRQSVTSAAINLVNIHPAAREIEICRKGKGTIRPVVAERGRLFRGVRVIGSELDPVGGLPRIEQHHRVIDSQAGEAYQMHDGRSIVPYFRHQALGGSALVITAEGEDHPPMAALEITLPRAATLRFQEFVLALAKGAQVRVPGNDNSLLLRQSFARTRRNHLANPTPVRGRVGFRQGGIEAGV